MQDDSRERDDPKRGHRSKFSFSLQIVPVRYTTSKRVEAGSRLWDVTILILERNGSQIVKSVREGRGGCKLSDNR